MYTAESELLLTIGPKSLTARDRVALSGAIRLATDQNRVVHLRGGELQPIILSHPLPNALAQWDTLLSEVAQRTRFGESTPPECSEAWASRLFFHLYRDLASMLQEMRTLVRVTTPALGPNGGDVAFALTMEGWREAHKLRDRRGTGRQAFVAMWFHDGMSRAFNDGMAPALKDAGYEPYRVDFAHHERRIDDEMMAQIRRSNLMLADLTGGRPSVYYEAGFAEGLGIPVIWSCNESWIAYAVNPKQIAPQLASAPECVPVNWFDCVAFDTKHLPFLLWKNEGELRKKLLDRIQGLGLDIAKRA
jgi:nucleoside 2-deoxyribosyltransferase